MRMYDVGKALKAALLFILMLLLLNLISKVSGSFQAKMAESSRLQTVVTILCVSPLLAALWYVSDALRQCQKPWSFFTLPVRLTVIGLGILMVIQVVVVFLKGGG